MKKLYEKKDIRPYRDDGLTVLNNNTGQEPQKLKKSIQAIFRENDLKITIERNLITVDYLDVTFTLQIPLIVHSIKEIMK